MGHTHDRVCVCNGRGTSLDYCPYSYTRPRSVPSSNPNNDWNYSGFLVQRPSGKGQNLSAPVEFRGENPKNPPSLLGFERGQAPTPFGGAERLRTPISLAVTQHELVGAPVPASRVQGDINGGVVRSYTHLNHASRTGLHGGGYDWVQSVKSSVGRNEVSAERVNESVACS